MRGKRSVKRFRHQIATSTVVAMVCFVVFAESSSGQRLPHFCRASTASAAAGSMDTYWTAVARGGRVVLLVNKKTVKPDEVIYARLANFSSSIVNYGRESSIERRTSNGWELDPSSPMGPWPRVLGRINPGGVGRCYRFDVPGEQKAGFYRFSTRVGLPSRLMRETAKFAV